MINPCTCTKRGGSSSSSKKQTKNKTSKPCKNCSKNPTIPEEKQTMLSSSNNTVGLDLPRAIVPCVSWKTAKRAVRRARTSFTADNNRAKIATNSNSNGSGDNNGTDEEFKGTDQVPVSESEKFGVTILGRRFSDEIQNVPIKKRKCLLVVSSPPPVSVYETVLNAESNCGVESLQDYKHQADFSGISILADAACETEFPVPELEPSRNESGTVVAVEIPTVIPAQKDENGNNDELDKDSCKDSRFKWDLNTVMETWECDEQDGSLAESARKGADVAGKTENIICKDTKEIRGTICDEEMNGGMKCEEESELKERRLDFNEVELKDEGEIISQGDPPKESIVEESNVIRVEKKESIVEESNVSQFELNGDESKDEEGEITQAEPPKESIVEESHVGQVDLNGGAESNLLTQPAVLTDSNVERESEIIKPIDSNNLSVVGPSNEEPVSDLPDLTNVCDQNDSVQINLNDSAPIKSMDDQASPNSLQLDLDPSILKNEANLDSTQLNPSSLSTVIESEIENGRASKPGEETLHHPIVGDTAGTEFCIEKMDENVGDINPDVSKDLNKKTERETEEEEEEQEEYQYEDGELREPPITDHWAADPSEEELPKSERGACESVKQDINHHHNLIEPAQNDTLEAELPLPPVAETDKTHFEEIRDDWDTETNEKPEFLERTDLDERPKSNNGRVLNKEFVSESSRVKRTGWDRLPESSTKNNRDSVRRDPSSFSRLDGRPRSFEAPRRNDKPFVRPRRFDEDEIADTRSDRRVLTEGSRPLGRRGDERRARAGPTRHRSPPAHQEFSAPSYAPSNSKNATAASIAKVKSNGFVVAPDGTLVKAAGPAAPAGAIRREVNNVCLSRERELSPAERFHHHPHHHHHRRPVRVTDVCSRRGGKVHVNVVHHQSHLSSPVHVLSRSRSRTRSPNAWRRSPPPCRAGPGYTNHVSPHGARWLDDRRCARRSPPPRVHSPVLTRVHSPVLTRVHSPVPPRRLRGEEYLHHHHLPAVHVGRCSGYEMSGPYRHEFERNFNNGFRPRNNNKMTEFERRGVDFDRRRADREQRDGGGFKFARGRGRRNNAGFNKRYDDDIRDSRAHDRDIGDGDGDSSL